MEVERRINTEVLKKVAQEGFIGFSIKAKDNECNEQVHKEFREFARQACDNNYTVALKLLLDNKESDYKYEMLYNTLIELQDRVAVLEIKPDENKDEDKKNAF